jgi:hypothetical protein
LAAAIDEGHDEKEKKELKINNEGEREAES